MPLFTYKCKKCENVVEKFQHNPDSVPELTCEDCGNTEFQRVFPTTLVRKHMDAKEMISEKINPDIDRIMEKVGSGSDADFLDICGEE